MKKSLITYTYKSELKWLPQGQAPDIDIVGRQVVGRLQAGSNIAGRLLHNMQVVKQQAGDNAHVALKRWHSRQVAT
jgi:hypothetical protein